MSAGGPDVVPGPAARTKPAAPIAPPTGKPASHAAPAPAGDGLLLRDPSPVGPHAEIRPAPSAITDETEDAAPSRRSPAMLAVAALVLLLLAGGGLYYQFGRTPKDASTPAATDDG